MYHYTGVEGGGGKGEKGETKLALEACVTRKSTDSRRLRCCFERNVCIALFSL